MKNNALTMKPDAIMATVVPACSSGTTGEAADIFREVWSVAAVILRLAAIHRVLTAPELPGAGVFRLRTVSLLPAGPSAEAVSARVPPLTAVAGSEDRGRT